MAKNRAAPGFIKNMSIRTRFIVGFLLTILFCIGGSAYLINAMARKVITETATHYVVNSLSRISVEMENMFLNAEQVSRVIVAEPMIQNYLRADEINDSIVLEIERFAKKTEISSAVIDSIYIFDARGRMITGDRHPDRSLPPDLLIEKAGSGKGGLVLAPYENTSRIFPLVKQIRAMNGFKTIGYLQVNVKDAGIRRSVIEEESFHSASFFIMDSDKNLIVQLGSAYVPDDLPAYLPAMSEGHGYASVGAGNDMTAIWYNVNFNGWTYFILLPTAELLSDLKDVMSIIFIGELFIVAIAVFAAIKISYEITNPIKEVVHSLHSFQNQDFDVRLTYDSDNEIGQLYKAFNNMAREIKRLVEQVYKLEVLEKEQQLKALQATMNPHFLYNTLDTINHMAKRYGAEAISDIALSLAKLLRSSIESSDEGNTLRYEFEMTEKYLNIQKIRFGDRLHVSYELDDDLLDIPVPRLILQPVVENSFIHGFESMTDGCKIEITAMRHGDGVCEVQITDNGKGIAPGKEDALFIWDDKNENDARWAWLENSERIGLWSVDRRIKLMYGKDFGIRIDRAHKRGFKVSILLPITNVI